MKTARFFFALALSLTLLTLGGCGDNESLMEAQSTASAPLFARYVAMGNSITAGYQSAGINTFTQNDSYAVMLANRMETTFNAPLLAFPGCPPPLSNALTGARVATVPGPGNCALRQTPAETIHNVAVPGSEVVDVLDNAAGGQFGSNPNALTTVLLGGRTQLEAALDADPTFVSLWTGNNDVLGAALTGDTRLITPPDSFRSRYTRILDALEDSGVQGGMLIGVADVTLVPVLQPGAFYLGLSQDSTAQQALPDNVSVSSSCAPRAEGGRLVSFSYASNLIARADTVDQAVALDCADDAGTLTEQEVGALTSAVNDYNDFISSQAEERGWAYVNPNDLFRAQSEDIPSCEIAPTDGRLVGCPDFTSQNPFGPLFSLDGVHPTGQAHQLVAGAAAQAIDEQYDTNISAGQ